MGKDNTSLHAYLDGQLGPEEAADIEALLDEDPEQRETFEAMARQKALIAEAAEALDRAPANLRTARLEQELTDALHKRVAPSKPFQPAGWMVQMAAALALVSFGWVGHDYFSASATAGVPGYVSDAVGAHRVFAESGPYPLEFDAASAGLVANWFAENTGHTLGVPGLEALGLDLVGARLLGSEVGPFAQFLYEDQEGGRVSLVVADHPEHLPLHALEVVNYPNRDVAYWRNSDLDYAIVSQSNSVDFTQIAIMMN
ncbi:anti-sigma factor [Tateyamaria sp. ANG-S1]|uniref:anti-sigma factor family protein n=1 Tax=Tateyamaria sp. ANG-S1 TaxID=1577905 RepID=UPI000689E54E|nr:anti-sigma factor [Tateyamaria sp. ANG-S1]